MQELLPRSTRLSFSTRIMAYTAIFRQLHPGKPGQQKRAEVRPPAVPLGTPHGTAARFVYEPPASRPQSRRRRPDAQTSQAAKANALCGMARPTAQGIGSTCADRPSVCRRATYDL
ncbi:hypothetical protein CNY67_00465 [Desulfovibrio sp. G11]|nr:hypothetical protein CNY67_00465 [Desulfovibrio sp. G11]